MYMYIIVLCECLNFTHSDHVSIKRLCTVYLYSCVPVLYSHNPRLQRVLISQHTIGCTHLILSAIVYIHGHNYRATIPSQVVVTCRQCLGAYICSLSSKEPDALSVEDTPANLSSPDNFLQYCRTVIYSNSDKNCY